MTHSFSKQLGLNVSINTTQCRFIYNEDDFKNIDDKILKLCQHNITDLQPILINDLIDLPKNIYTEIRNIYDEKLPTSFRHNLILLPPQMVGIEYNKTHVYTSPTLATNLKAKIKKLSCILECVYGACVVTVQHRKPLNECYEPEHPEVYEAGIAKLAKGEKLPIFAGYDYVIHNIKNNPTVVSKIYKHEYKWNYDYAKIYKGLGYYVIRKIGKAEIVSNAHYKTLPKMKLLKHKELMKKYDLDTKQSLYMDLIEDPSKYDKYIDSFISINEISKK